MSDRIFQKQLKAARRDALEAAFPEWSNQTVSREIHKYEQGKSSPTQTKVRRVFVARGLA